MFVWLNRFDVRVSIVYAVIAALWIIASDTLVNLIFSGNESLTAAMSIFKGIGFVFVSTLALFTILSRELRQRVSVEVGLQKDIIERKQVEAEQVRHALMLEDIHHFAQATVDALPASTSVLATDGTILSVNNSWKRFGTEHGSTSLTHFVGSNYLTICDSSVGAGADEAQTASEGIRAVIDGQSDYFSMEYPYPTPTRNFWFRLLVNPFDEPAPRRVVVAQIDITELKEAEEALQKAHFGLEQRVVARTLELSQANARLKAILDNSVNAILLVDASLQIQQTNLVFNRLFRSADTQRLNPTLLDFIAVDELPRVTAFIDLVRVEQTNKLIETRVLGNDGTFIDVELSVAFMIDDGCCVPLHDITARKEAENSLRNALERERELSILKSRFVSIASHEFRNPLAAIFTSTEILEKYRSQLTEEQVDERLGKVKQLVKHLTNLVGDVLNLSRMQSGGSEFKPAPCDLDELCRDILDEFRQREDMRHRLRYSTTVSPIVMNLDKRFIRQILTNLLSNAIKYSPENKDVLVSVIWEDDAAVLRVEDHGIGIPEAALKHLFTPFHRAENVEGIQGTGLGLSITKQAIELHGGSINVESVVGEGTIILVRLPLSS